MQLEWSATQNYSANTSTVTARLYWMGLDQYSAVYSSSSNSAVINIAGSTKSVPATAGLSAGQKKLIASHSYTVGHNGDGTRTLALSAYFDANVNLAGVQYNRVNLSRTETLNAIPRESTLTADPTWRIGEILPLSVNRASSAFTHVAELYLMNTAGGFGSVFKTIEFSASRNVGFSEEEYTTMIARLNGNSSMTSRVVLKTYNGSSLVGTTTRDGVAMAPLPSELTSGYDKYKWLNETIDYGITRNMSGFTHTVRFKLGSYTKTFTGIGTQITWTPNQSEQAALLAQMPGVTAKAGTVEIDTFYNGYKVRSTTTAPIEFYIPQNIANPTMSGTATYADTNSTTVGITDNSQTIISGKSSVTAYLTAGAATAAPGSTIEKYVFRLAGRTIERDYTSSAIAVAFGTINASSNQTLVVEAVDSRGLKAQVSKTVNVVPYTPPSLSVSAGRANGFEELTTLATSGSISTVTVGTTPKNNLLTLRYRTRAQGSSWSGYSSIPFSTSGSSLFSGTNRTLSFDITKSYEVEVQATDRLSTTTVKRTVPVGTPLLFIDTDKMSVGVNKFPTRSKSFEVDGPAYVNGALDVEGDVDVEGQLVFTSGIDSKITNETTGMRLYGNTSSGYMEILGNSTLRLSVKTNRPRFSFDSPIEAPTFQGDLVPATNKLPNGYNLVTQRTNTTHSDPVMIQETTVLVSVSGGGGDAMMTFPTAFNSTPDWVLAVAVDANANTANVAVYSPTTTGCQIHVKRVDTFTGSYTVRVRVVACGRRS